MGKSNIEELRDYCEKLEGMTSSFTKHITNIKSSKENRYHRPFTLDDIMSVCAHMNMCVHTSIINDNICYHLNKFKMNEIEDEFENSIKPILEPLVEKISIIFNIYPPIKDLLPRFEYIRNIKASDFINVSYEVEKSLPKLKMLPIPRKDNEYIETLFVPSDMIPSYIVDEPESKMILGVFVKKENYRTRPEYMLYPSIKKYDPIYLNHEYTTIHFIFADNNNIVCCKRFILNEEIHDDIKKIIKKIKSEIDNKYNYKVRTSFSNYYALVNNVSRAVYGLDRPYELLTHLEDIGFLKGRSLYSMFGKNLIDEVESCEKKKKRGKK